MRINRILTYLFSTSFISKKVAASGLSVIYLITVGTSFNYAAPGDLDTGFGNGGKVITPVGSGNANDQAYDVAVQPDGKIILVGATGVSSQTADFAVLRYNADGTLDASFGSGGKVTTAVGSAADLAFAVAVQPDGKILVAGYSNNENGVSRFALVRYNTNGLLDPNFGSNGIVLTAFGNPNSIDEARANDLILQFDGKIVLTGRVAGFPGGFAAARYNANGSLDTDFGSGGKSVFATDNAFPSSAALQTDGKIVIAGYIISENGTDDFAAVRLNPNGSPDTSFGTNGKVITSVGEYDRAYDVAVQRDGKILLVGSASGITPIFDAVGIVRYNPNGTLDVTFDGDGKFTTSGSDARSVIIQPDNKILTAGYGTTQSGNFAFGLVRCNPNGALDSSFGSGGKVITSFNSNGGAQANAAVLQADGRIVAAGTVYDGTQNDFAVARYLNDTFPPRRPAFDFDGDGRTDYGLFRPSNGVWYLQQSTAGFAASAFGVASDKTVPADYDGDGRTDIAVYRSGTWYLQRSSLGFAAISFGTANDVPVPTDFDGDGKAELAVFRPSNGVWYLLNLTNNQFSAISFGQSGDKAIPADFDGDGKTDVAVFRPSNGTWYLLQSTNGFAAVSFGISSDVPLAADFDGDGKADQAVFRAGNWYLNRSSAGFAAVSFGVGSDKPSVGDYDGDGKADITVWRPENGVFYLLLSGSNNQFGAFAFGQNGDQPIASSFVP